MDGISTKVGYGGNPMHKRNQGDFRLDPPSDGRQHKTLCDRAKVFTRAEATRLLKQGAAYGLVSDAMKGDWPKNIWAVAQNGEPVEAILENETQGIYHGYSMGDNDPMAASVRQRWSAATCR
ncbi:hypothetical protein JL101_003545 [Skermanella rosea]|uniref:hypothetical protein n=1 Tax=Skermanella rosea TaxID=1817965 RepID=UPI0019330070|nr:hypothetical protein [Skermanella rosea]UEM04530.1 hypothetical protein JL101_003545 [Skermanella rosea]